MTQPANPHAETLAAPTTPAPDPQAAPALPAALRADGANGAPGRASRAAKAGRRNVRAKRFAMVALVVVVLVGTAGAYVLIEKPFHKARTDLVTSKVRRGTLELKIVERGQLEAAHN